MNNKILGQRHVYVIYEHALGFNAVVKPRNKWRYFIELLDDYMGTTSIHPVFLSRVYLPSMEIVKKHIKIIEQLKIGQ